MNIYLVRHGQTEGNLALRLQSDKSQLTDEGVRQAQAAAATLESLHPTHLVSSTMVRALETARIIGKSCDLVAETEDVFREIGRPERMNGQLLMNVASFWFYTRWYLGLTRDEEGSESYKQVRERVRASQIYLESLPEEAKVVVVTHSVFIIFFVAHMCHQRAMGPLRALHALYRISRIKNGSITPIILNHKAPKGRCRFTLG